MLSRFLRSAPPILQLLMLFLFASVSSLLFMSAGQLIGMQIWGINAFDTELLSDYTNPDALACLKLVTMFYHLGFFILPSLIFAQRLSTPDSDFLMIRKRPDFVNTTLCVGAVLCTFFIINWLIHINEMIPLGGELGQRLQELHQESITMSENMLSANGFGNLAFNLLVLAIIPAVGEELMFRGMFIKLLTRSTKNIHVGIWLTAILFGLIHLQFYNMLAIVFMGALFGYLLIWTGNIWVPILAHFLNNTVTVILSYLIYNEHLPEDFDMFQGNYISLAVSGVLFIVLLFVIHKNSRWQAIKHEYLNY